MKSELGCTWINGRFFVLIMKKLTLQEIQNKKYGRLVVLSESHPIKYSYRESRVMNCLCDCGKKTLVHLSRLRANKTQSCGCIHSEIISDLFTKHGLRNTPEYSVWHDMKRRCFDKNRKRYKDYGGRGIKVSESWMKFSNFIKDMGFRPSKKHSLERINNNKDYSKDNCKWATTKEQSLNTRSNVYLEYNGIKLTLKEWSEKLNLKYTTIYSRYNRGWEVERILTSKLERNYGKN